MTLTPDPSFPEDMRERVERWLEEQLLLPWDAREDARITLARWALERDAEARRLQGEWYEAANQLGVIRSRYERVEPKLTQLRERANAAEAKLAEAERRAADDREECEARGKLYLEYKGRWMASEAKLAAGRAEANKHMRVGGIGNAFTYNDGRRQAAEAIRRAMDGPSSSAATPPSPPQ